MCFDMTFTKCQKMKCSKEVIFLRICNNCFSIIEKGDICNECSLRRSARELKEEYGVSDEEIIERFKYLMYTREENIKNIICRLEEISMRFDII